MRISPLAAGLVFAAFAAVILIPGPIGTPASTPVADPLGAPQAVVYVQFLLDAPAATSVAVAGDFSEWEPQFALDDADGDGIWTGRVPIRPGVHSYMFLIDGTQWQTDPYAGRYQDDGFGNRNAVLAVAAGA
ncbi:MAG: glycogen-binding domain-containing protein [Gemmatimonadetes bacterium]|nr:glycogen-binding domain-containing protein [Gemmatimonadota bacterium]MDA1103124.1 glycogen-binding domain-containing protein [Gemmatimonadota bacterium]